MNIRNYYHLLLGTAVLVSLLAGFGLGQFFDTPVSTRPLPAETGNQPHEEEHEHGAGENIVTLTQRQIDASDIRIVPVSRGGGQETRLTGRVELIRGARAAIAATVSGQVEQVSVSPGFQITQQQTVATVLSGEAASLRAQADAAAAEAEAARLAYERDLSLLEQGVVARQELEASRSRSVAAEASARAAQAQVTTAGSPDTQGRVAITSPITGVVGEVSVTPGGFVTAGEIVAEVVDPSRTELVFTAPPALAARVAQGAHMSITGPAGNFEAEVIGVAADVHEHGGAAIIRARSISGSSPPAGSPVAAAVTTNQQAENLTVPADAVQVVSGQSVVFVATDEGFRATPVFTGFRAGGRIEILSGLSGSERIAGSNAFLLKAELAKGEAEHGH